ncbi:MAG: hypothetical protein IKF72_01885 [Kiritimatiellae bacterium]|nr:hypothetical protein [Kiritimatiellia bacterium]
MKMLVRMRLRMAMKRHAQHFYRSISDRPKFCREINAQRLSVVGGDDVDHLKVSDCVPGRRYWPRPRREVRASMDCDKAQENALVAKMLRDIEDDGLSADWKGNFLALSRRIRTRIDSGEISFKRPQLHLLEKGRNEFRCLATYENLADRIIIGRLATYLRDVFDSQMRDNSYAFRKDGKIKHLTAIRTLRDFRLRYLNRKLYVAECDIQKFFDIIHHDVAMDAFKAFAVANESEIEPWMWSAVRAYLESYSSFRNLEEDADVPDEQKKLVGFNSSVKLRKAIKKIYGNISPRSLPLGIPQGGALSPLLINLVLHRADEAVLSGDDGELFYARYCDDMVIVHPDVKKCKAAFDRYLMMMESLRLPVHPVTRGMRYGKEFFEGKSKGPYAWTDCRYGGLRSSPWVSFLGEQIRFDGEVRVRLESVEKQQQKLQKEKGLLQRAIGKSGVFLKRTLNMDEVFNRFCSRLISIGVGYSPWECMGNSADRCWMAAFPGITNSRWTRLQMKKLDRSRDRVISAVKHGCLKSKKEGEPTSFFGRPFSYRGFLEREERPDKYSFMDGVPAYGEW